MPMTDIECPNCGHDQTSLGINTYRIESLDEFVVTEAHGETLPITVGCWRCGWKDERDIAILQR